MLRQKMEHGERGFVKRVKRRKNVWRKSEIILLKKACGVPQAFFTLPPDGWRFHTRQAPLGALFLLRSQRHV